MILSRRNMLGMASVSVLVVGTGLLSTKAHAANRVSVPVPPRNRRGPHLRIQPPFKLPEHKYQKRLKKTKHKTRLKARSLRAQMTYDTPGNRHDLACTMWGEARGYGTLGMECIGHVIMNRVKAEKTRFGDGINGVCHKRKQFSCWNKNDPNLAQMKKLPHMDETSPDWIAFMKADKLAGEILAGIRKDTTGGATYYFAESMRPYWIGDMIIVGVMFGHMFCKLKPRRARKKSRRVVSHKKHSTHH